MTQETIGHTSAVSRTRFIGPAVVLLAAAVAVAPEFVHGNSCGHDFDFHLVSWLDCLNSWRHGIPYPHWTAAANYGAGEARFVFYPPLTWMAGAALGAVLPWSMVPVALTFLMLAAGGLATRALARIALNDAAATLAGCAALYSGYTLFCAYERTAFGELSGSFWIPLLLLLALQGREGNPSSSPVRRALDGSAAPLALVVAGTWLSNVPLGVMAIYLLAGVALAAALLQKSWAPVMRAVIASAVGIGLAAIYLFPAAYEQHWVDVRVAIDDPGAKIESSWLFARHADPTLAPHDVVLHQASILVVAMMAVALAGLLASWLRGRLPGRPRWWIPIALIPVVVLLLQFPVSLPLWNLLPKLRFLQFPWRWLVVVEAPMAIFFASAVWPANSARPWRRIAVLGACIAVFTAMTTVAAVDFFQPCDDEDAVPGMLDTYRSGQGVPGTDEYAAMDADDAQIATGLPAACLVTDPFNTLGRSTGDPDANPVWQPDQDSCDQTFSASQLQAKDHSEHFELRGSTVHAGYLVLRLTRYPAWRVMLNGRRVAGPPRRNDGLLTIPVPQGPVELTVDWTAAPDVIAGRWLSALAVLLLTALWLLERKLARPRL
jgi:hypothetical protein